jgi:hypothetical protein
MDKMRTLNRIDFQPEGFFSEGLHLEDTLPVTAVQKQSDLYDIHFEMVRDEFTSRETAVGKLTPDQIERRINSLINSLIEKIDRGPMGLSHDIVTRLLPNFMTAVGKGIPQFIHYHLDRLLGEIPDAIEAKMHHQPRCNYGEVVISYQKEGLTMKYFVEVERRTGNPWTDADGVQYCIVSEEDTDSPVNQVSD